MPRPSLRHVSAVLLGAVILLAAAPFVRSEREASFGEIWSLIEPDGTARFFLVRDDVRMSGWTVNCRVPMRGCVARSQGLVLRLDENREPWLIAALSPNTRLFLETSETREEIEGVFSKPLSRDTLDSLSRGDVHLVAQEVDRSVHRMPTAGVKQVADYLEWLQTNTARAARDARTWPGRDMATDMSTG